MVFIRTGERSEGVGKRAKSEGGEGGAGDVAERVASRLVRRDSPLGE